MKYDVGGHPIHPTKNPPWSQAICQSCYFKRFGVSCRALANSPRHATEPCIDCGLEAITPEGEIIYIDPRPARRVKGQHFSGTVFQAEAAAWREFVMREVAK